MFISDCIWYEVANFVIQTISLESIDFGLLASLISLNVFNPISFTLIKYVPMRPHNYSKLKTIIGMGFYASAINGAKIVKNLPKNLDIPKDVYEILVGNSSEKPI